MGVPSAIVHPQVSNVSITAPPSSPITVRDTPSPILRENSSPLIIIRENPLRETDDIGKKSEKINNNNNNNNNNKKSVTFKESSFFDDDSEIEKEKVVFSQSVPSNLARPLPIPPSNGKSNKTPPSPAIVTRDFKTPLSEEDIFGE